MSEKIRGRPPYPDILTPGEWRVAEGIRHGLSNPQIAERQGVSKDAVKFHISNILGKLGLASREELRLWNGIAAESALKNRPNMAHENGIGPIGQIARSVSDLKSAETWYAKTLGLRHLFSSGTMTFFDCGGTRLMLSETEPKPESILYFSVEDIQREYERLLRQRAKILSAPHRVHTHKDGAEEWMCFLEDNDGRPIGLMSVVQREYEGESQ